MPAASGARADDATAMLVPATSDANATPTKRPVPAPASLSAALSGQIKRTVGRDGRRGRATRRSHPGGCRHTAAFRRRFRALERAARARRYSHHRPRRLHLGTGPGRRNARALDAPHDSSRSSRAADARCKTPRAQRLGGLERREPLRAMRRFTRPSSLSSTTQPRQEGVPHRHGMAESAGHP